MKKFKCEYYYKEFDDFKYVKKHLKINHFVKESALNQL